MKSDKTVGAPLQDVKAVVENLQELSEKLMTVMDKQTEAVVVANEKHMEKNAERYTTLKAAFKEQEKKFVVMLREMIPPKEGEVEGIGLQQLKKKFPQSKFIIDSWRNALGKQARKLKRKHERLNELIEFALNRNVELMHSIYTLHNQTNTHYSSGGSTEEISSGVAINKEA